jgi:hypothetical protein
MEQITVNYIPLYTLGYLHTRVPSDILSDLNNQANSILLDNFQNVQPHNNGLYGAIKNEFILPNKQKLSGYILELCKHFWNFQYNNTNANKKHKLDVTWINFQKKYEHNPVHNHDGDLSFVIWLKIPYNLEDEKNVGNVKNSKQFTEETASFSFLYSTPHTDYRWTGINKHPIPMTKEREGEIILFKSSLPHMVYPFYTSDEYRISISGNIIIED